jgi:hypothetical protein
MRAMFPQHCLLGRRRFQAVTGHTKTLASTTDIFRKVVRFPLAEDWGPTPRLR